MKNVFSFLIAVVMLTFAYAVSFGATRSHLCAATVTMGLSVFSAIMQVSRRKLNRRERRSLSRAGFAFTGIVIPDFTEKSIEDYNAMSVTEKGDYLKLKRAYDDAVTSKKIQDQIDKYRAEDAEKHKEDIDKLDATLKALIDESKAQALRIQSYVETSNGTFGFKTIQEQVNKFIEENHSKIKTLKGQGHGVVEFEIKAVANMTSGNQVITAAGNVGTAGSATNPDGIPQLVGVQMAPPSRANLRNTFVESLASRFTTSLAAYPYTETIPKDGDFAFVAEGAAKPQLDFKIETRYAQPVKAAGWVRLTDESVQDIPGLQSIATGYLRDKHDIRKQRGILFGDGVSPNPLGATEYARVFSAGDLAGTVEAPNFMDVINAAITDVFTTHNYEDEMPYMPSLVLINPVDFFIQITSAKDGEGHPLYPQASLFNMLVIGGVTIMPDEMIPVGKIFVADMSKYNISDYVGYTVKIGWINDDFIKNQFVMLGESRFHAFVRKLDEQAFIYDDIATIKEAITVVPTP